MDYVHKPVPKFASHSDSLTIGPQQPALYKNTELHPTKQMQDNIVLNGERQDLAQMSVLYGSHLPMRFVLERSFLATQQRPGGYGSSMHGLKMHMGRYDELDFFDVMGDVNLNPGIDKEGVHARMEKAYGIRS